MEQILLYYLWQESDEGVYHSFAAADAEFRMKDDDSIVQRLEEMMGCDLDDPDIRADWDCMFINLPQSTVDRIKKKGAEEAAKRKSCQNCKHHHDCGTHFCARLGMDCPDDAEFSCSYWARKEVPVNG